MKKLQINKNLVCLKLFLFCFVGAVGSSWPFLTLHMSQLGLTVEEIAVINLILPFMAAFCKPFIGIIADKTGRYKLIMSIMMLATGTFFTFILLIPSKPIQAKQTTTTFPFTCSPNGAFLQVSCDQIPIPTSWIDIKLSQCNCSSTNFNTFANLPKQQMPKTNLCFTSPNSTNCLNLKSDEKVDFEILLKEPSSALSQCQIQASKIQGLLTDLHCQSIECPVECVSTITIPIEVTHDEAISLTFWLYLALRTCADVFLSACYPISDSINLSLTSHYGGSFGQQQILALFGFGIFAPLSGVIVDYVSKSVGKPTYTSCFILADVLLICATVLVAFMPNLEIKKQSQSMTKGFKLLLSNPAVITLFLVCIGMGVMWGYLEIFLNLYLVERGATKLTIGLIQLVCVIPTLPILYKSMWILEKVGPVNVLIFGIFVYSIRCTGYVFLLDPAWAFLLESTRCFSVFLPRIAFTIYVDTLTTPELKVTAQSLVFLLHFDIGRGVGSLIGGTLKDYFGDVTTFQLIAVYAGLLGCTYFSIYHFYLKHITTKVGAEPSAISTVCDKGQHNSTLQNGHLDRVEKPLLSPEC